MEHLPDDLERGGFEVGVRGADVERVLSRLEALPNRVVLAVLASGFIMGLAELMAVYHPPGWQAWAGLAFGFGFLPASVSAPIRLEHPPIRTKLSLTSPGSMQATWIRGCVEWTARCGSITARRYEAHVG